MARLTPKRLDSADKPAELVEISDFVYHVNNIIANKFVEFIF